VMLGTSLEASTPPRAFARVPLRLSLGRLAILVTPLAVVEWVVYPLLLHDSTKWWLSYIAYLALGVILPGTLVAQAFVRWRADWLTWIAIGWALGHVFEVLSIQLAKTVGLPRLFLVWIPIAYLVAWRKRQWQGDVTTVRHPVQCAVLLAVVVSFASATFFTINLLELSPQPTYQSDVWFHITEAAEFRDHLNTADPRIAGRPYAYHTLEYGPAVGANLAVQVPLANLITRYSGMSLVWLLVLLLFNSARHIRSPAAGFLSAALIVAPLDVFSLISSKLSFGSSIIYSGLDGSTSTLVGFCALAALFLPLRWFFMGGRIRDLWVVGLLGYVAAGSKSVPGPLLLAAAGAVIVGTVLQLRKPSLRSVLLMGVFAAIFSVTALPILLRATVADSATVTFASAARLNPFANELPSIPAWLRLGFYPIGLSFLLWIGAAFGVWKLMKRGEGELCWFLVGALLVAAVIVEGVSIPGESELFFLYMGMVLIAPVAGTGLCHLGWLLWRGRNLVTPIVTIVIVASALGLHVKVGGEPSPPFYDGSRWAAGLYARVTEGVQLYQDPGPPSPPSFSWSNGGRRLRVTPAVLDGLKWLRGDADSQSVIATNVPGAALYAALCECREYYQTDRYAPEFIAAELAHSTASLFVDRERLLTAWILGQPGSVEALRRVGITYLIVDHLNGFPIRQQDMPPPAFSNADISIYRL
jgi:hypothetical protein